MDKKIKIIYAVCVGAIAAVIFITVITVAADLYLPLKNLLADVFYHHWIAKGVLSIIIFLIVGSSLWIMPAKADNERVNIALKILIWLAIIGTLAIFGFFSGVYFASAAPQIWLGYY